MSDAYLNLHGYYLYYDENNYTADKDALDYMYKLDESQMKTLFDAAQMDGEANFKTDYGYDYKIVYDYSTKMHTLLKR